MGLWHKSVEEYINKSKSTLNEQVYLKLGQTGEDEISTRVFIETASLSVVNHETPISRIQTTSFYDLGMTALNGDVGLVFVTAGNLSDDLNEAIYVPTAHVDKIRISSHVLVTN
jgi:hypothetical protein